MSVNVTVLPMARLQLTSVPAEIQLSADDLRRGFVDVTMPTSMVVNSNSADGFALDLLSMSPMIASFIVSGLDSEQALGAEGGTLVQRWQHPQSMRLRLRFRLMLAPGLMPGRYGWPLHFAVRPL